MAELVQKYKESQKLLRGISSEVKKITDQEKEKRNYWLLYKQTAQLKKDIYDYMVEQETTVGRYVPTISWTYIFDITFGDGKVDVMVDYIDRHLVNDHIWYVSKRGYVVTNIYHNGKRATMRLHRLVMGLDFGDEREIDHIDMNKLNNRRSNLRICEHVENMRNQKLQANNTSGYKGVCFDKKANKWCARINHQGRRIYLGYYLTPEEAAHAYDAKARELFGEYARYNFPLPGERSARDV